MIDKPLTVTLDDYTDRAAAADITSDMEKLYALSEAGKARIRAIQADTQLYRVRGSHKSPILTPDQRAEIRAIHDELGSLYLEWEEYREELRLLQKPHVAERQLKRLFNQAKEPK